MAIAINASPNRLHQFKELQPAPSVQSPRVGLIQDVKTRWNSTLLMMVRGKRMRVTIDEWIRLESTPEKYRELRLSDNEWLQINEAIAFLKPFHDYTQDVSHSRRVTITQAFFIYNDLFDHLTIRIRALRNSPVAPWIPEFEKAVTAAEDVLAKYYSKTGPKGLIYNLATILDPSKKLTLYAKWGRMPGNSELPRGSGRRVRQPPRPTYQMYYRSEFEAHYNTHYAHFIDQVSSSSRDTGEGRVSYLMQRLQQTTEQSDTADPELSRYLNSPIVLLEDGNPLPWWQANEERFPTLAIMAKDILSVPIASVSTERAFSMARDVIPYRRNRLGPQMIRALMLAKAWDNDFMEFGASTADSDEYPCEEDESDSEREGNEIFGDFADIEYMTYTNPRPPVGDWVSSSEDEDGEGSAGEESDETVPPAGAEVPQVRCSLRKRGSGNLAQAVVEAKRVRSRT